VKDVEGSVRDGRVRMAFVNEMGNRLIVEAVWGIVWRGIAEFRGEIDSG